MPILPVLLPDGFLPVVKQTDTVLIGTVLAIKAAHQEAHVNIAEELGVPIRKVAGYLVKSPGETILTGETIACKKNFLGKTIAKVVCETDGVLTRFERDTGIVYVQPKQTKDISEEASLFSPIEGTIALCNNEKILIDTNKDVLHAVKGIGAQQTAEVVFLGDAETVAPYLLGPEAIGNIAYGRYFSKETLMKGISMGVAGIIGTKISDTDLYYLRQRKTSIPIVQIEESDATKIAHWKGKKAYIDGEGKTIIVLHEKI